MLLPARRKVRVDAGGGIFGDGYLCGREESRLNFFLFFRRIDGWEEIACCWSGTNEREMADSGDL